MRVGIELNRFSRRDVRVGQRTTMLGSYYRTERKTRHCLKDSPIDGDASAVERIARPIDQTPQQVSIALKYRVYWNMHRITSEWMQKYSQALKQFLLKNLSTISIHYLIYMSCRKRYHFSCQTLSSG